MDNKEEETNVAPQSIRTANSGDPITIAKLEVDGVSGGIAVPGQTVKMFTQLGITSDSPLFHKMAEGLCRIFDPIIAAKIHKAEYVLVVIKQDRSAQVWIDTAAVAMSAVLKRPAQAGALIFQADLVDIHGMMFPHVEIGTTDQVIVLFREQWRFALYFDFNPERSLDVAALSRHLGTLYRSLAHRNLYEFMADADLRAKLLEIGWFPFAEIAQQEFDRLALAVAAGGNLIPEENSLIEKFDRPRCQDLLNRWSSKPSFAPKISLFSAAIEAFLRKDAVSTIKIILTEIEGVLNNEYQARHGKRLYRVEALLNFAVAAAQEKAGGPDTLLFPLEFSEYLEKYTFASFKQEDGGTADASSRHAVGHGGAAAESYTMTTALQALLTLDQLLFYL